MSSGTILPTGIAAAALVVAVGSAAYCVSKVSGIEERTVMHENDISRIVEENMSMKSKIDELSIVVEALGEQIEGLNKCVSDMRRTQKRAKESKVISSSSSSSTRRKKKNKDNTDDIDDDELTRMMKDERRSSSRK